MKTTKTTNSSVLPVDELLAQRERAVADVDAAAAAVKAAEAEAMQAALKLHNLEVCQELHVLPPDDDRCGEAVVELNNLNIRLRDARRNLADAQQILSGLDAELAGRQEEVSKRQEEFRWQAAKQKAEEWIKSHRTDLWVKLREAEREYLVATKNFGEHPTREDRRSIVDSAQGMLMMARMAIDEAIEEYAKGLLSAR